MIGVFRLSPLAGFALAGFCRGGDVAAVFEVSLGVGVFCAVWAVLATFALCAGAFPATGFFATAGFAAGLLAAGFFATGFFIGCAATLVAGFLRFVDLLPAGFVVAFFAAALVAGRSGLLAAAFLATGFFVAGLLAAADLPVFFVTAFFAAGLADLFLPAFFAIAIGFS
ncbi:MAG TPA: hypothetical protein PKC03_00035 [Dokdonella sp.]|nr:hypothetical protein [Dokdonella sp.]